MILIAKAGQFMKIFTSIQYARKFKNDLISKRNYMDNQWKQGIILI